MQKRILSILLMGILFMTFACASGNINNLPEATKTETNNFATMETFESPTNVFPLQSQVIETTITPTKIVTISIATEIGTMNIPTEVAAIEITTADVNQNSLASQSVIITDIFYDGVEGNEEPDEYVEIKNVGTLPVDVTGWKLSDEADHVFVFPLFIMQPGQVCRVYTNQIHEEWCGFSFHETRSAIWNNGGDIATLRTTDLEIIVTKGY